MKELLTGFVAGVVFGVVMCGAGHMLGASLVIIWDHISWALR